MAESSSFSAWLNRQIAETGESVFGFARRAKIARSTLNLWLMGNGPKPLPKSIGKLAKALGVDYDVVDREVQRSQISGDDLQNIRVIAGKPRTMAPFPSLSAARLRENEDTGRDDSQAVLAGAADPAAFMAVLDGDCMVPKYRPGDTIIFSPTEVERIGVIPGKDYFIQLDGSGDGACTFKRVFLDPDDDTVFILRPLNPAHKERRVRRDSVIRMARAITRLERL